MNTTYTNMEYENQAYYAIKCSQPKSLPNMMSDAPCGLEQ